MCAVNEFEDHVLKVQVAFRKSRADPGQTIEVLKLKRRLKLLESAQIILSIRSYIRQCIHAHITLKFSMQIQRFE